jgi:hypothetical protein
MTLIPLPARRSCSLVFLGLLPLLLASCVDLSIPLPETSGVASLGGVLVQGEGQPALPGAQVSLYAAGDHSRLIARMQTGAGGEFSFSSLAAGRYDLTFAEPGYAASEVLGAVATEGPTPIYTVQQRPVRDPGAVLSVPQLVTARTDTAQPLSQSSANAFADRVGLRVQTTASSSHQRPLRAFEISLLQSGKGGRLAALRPAGSQLTPTPTADVADSGPLSLGVGPLSGEALLQVVATDFNNNRLAALYPVSLTPPAGGPVDVPDNVQAVAYTWATRGTDGSAAAQNLKVQAGSTPVTTLKVQVSWIMASVAGVRGYEVWRATSAAGPWAKAVLAGPDACNGGACSVADTSAGLQTGQDTFYRVTAVGADRADSALPGQPSTHPLPLFQPTMLSPTSGQSGVPTLPSYSLRAPLRALGASGAVLGLSVHDDLLGSGTPWQVGVLLRQVYGQTGQADGQADAQVLLSRGGRYEPVFSSLTPANDLAGVTYDAQAEQLTLKHNFDASGQALQPARRFRLSLDRAAALRLQDPGRPPGALNPVVAYSVFIDPTGSGAQDCPAQPLIPGGPCLDAGTSLEFTTGAGQ